MDNRYPAINVYDVHVRHTDVYQLNYYGILVFFEVCDVQPETIGLVELATKPYKNGVMLYEDRRTARHPYFVKRNVRSKTDYYVTLEEEKEGEFPVWIDYDSKIYKEAIKKGIKHPLIGTFWAIKLEKTWNIYWI